MLKEKSSRIDSFWYSTVTAFRPFSPSFRVNSTMNRPLARHKERDTKSTDRTNYISGTYIVCSATPQFVLSIVNETDNEMASTMRAAILRLSKSNVFVEPDGRNGCKFIMRQRERKRESKKKENLKRRNRRERSTVSREQGRRKHRPRRPSSSFVAKPVLSGADTYARRETEKSARHDRFHLPRESQMTPIGSRNIAEDAAAGCNRVTTMSFTSFVLQVTRNLVAYHEERIALGIEHDGTRRI